MYLSAIDFMYQFAQRGWDTTLKDGFVVWAYGYDVEIDIESSQGRYGPLELKTSHMVLGLYQTILQISTESKFCEVYATLSLHQRQIGTLKIQKKISQSIKANYSMNTMHNRLWGSEERPKIISATYPSGELIDSDDPRFVITYTYTGIRINSRDIFTAIIDALADSAQFSSITIFETLNARSASATCAISLSSTESPSQITYGFVTKTLRALIWGVMVSLAKFGEMTFELKWKDVNMAQGSIRVVAGEGVQQEE